MKGQWAVQSHRGAKKLSGEFPPGEHHSPLMVHVPSPAQLCKSRGAGSHRVVGVGLWPFGDITMPWRVFLKR